MTNKSELAHSSKSDCLNFNSPSLSLWKGAVNGDTGKNVGLGC